MPCTGHDLPYTVFLPKLNKSTKPNPAFSSIRRQRSQKNKLDSKKKKKKLDKSIIEAFNNQCDKRKHMDSGGKAVEGELLQTEETSNSYQPN